MSVRKKSKLPKGGREKEPEKKRRTRVGASPCCQSWTATKAGEEANDEDTADTGVAEDAGELK
jgi:hypothetical protein